MKITELKKLDTKELNEKLVELRNKSRELRFSVANNQLKAVRELRDVKKTIARILTVMNQNRISKESENVKKESTKEVKENQADKKSTKEEK